MDNEQRTIVEGLAAWAVSLSEMGAPREEALPQLRALLARLQESDAAFFRLAADAIAHMPQPYSEQDPAKAERYAAIMKSLGGQTPHEELEATLRAREWLEELAREGGA